MLPQAGPSRTQYINVFHHLECYTRGNFAEFEGFHELDAEGQVPLSGASSVPKVSG
jgi:hypothetical protein